MGRKRTFTEQANDKGKSKELVSPQQHKKKGKTISHNSSKSVVVSDTNRRESFMADARRSYPSVKKQKTSKAISISKPQMATTRNKPPPNAKLACRLPTPEHIVSESLHPWLSLLTGIDREKMLYYNSLIHVGERTIDDGALRTIEGARDRVRGFLDTWWRRLFRINCGSFKELTVEFVSTCKFESGIITFQLGGEDRRLSVKEWAVALGINTGLEIEDSVLDDALDDWPPKMKKNEKTAFWVSIAKTDPNVPDSIAKPRAQQITNSALRLIHRIISNTIHHRPESQANVSDADLFLLYALKNKQKVNLAYVLARYLKKFCQKNRPKKVTAGCFVTKVAEYFDILTEENRATLTPGPDTGTLDLKTLLNMQLVETRDGEEWKLGFEGGRIPCEVPVGALPAPAAVKRADISVAGMYNLLTSFTTEMRTRVDRVEGKLEELLTFVRPTRDGSGPSSAALAPLVDTHVTASCSESDSDESEAEDSDETSGDEGSSVASGSGEGAVDGANEEVVVPCLPAHVAKERAGLSETDVGAGVRGLDVGAGFDPPTQQ